jgi:hypothetical protein
LSLQSVDNVKRSDSLALGVLSVGNGVTNNALEEGLEYTTGLLVDHWMAVRRREEDAAGTGSTY